MNISIYRHKNKLTRLEISRQFEGEVTPLKLEYLPAAQETQADEAIVSENVPGTHKIHSEDEVAWATPEYLPILQGEHTDDDVAPVTLEYLPATQEMHSFEDTEDEDKYDPGVHTAEQLVAPDADTKPPEHNPQTLDEVAPDTEE